MNMPKPYSDKAIRAELKRHIRLYPREQLDEALLRYIKDNFVPALSIRKTDHLQANIDIVIGVVCRHFKMSLQEMSVKTREKEICYPRQVMQFILVTRTSMGLKAIGHLFDQDHTTVMSSRNKIVERYKKDPTVRRDIDEINELLPKRETEHTFDQDTLNSEQINCGPADRPPAEYSNQSPYGIADSLHQQKTA